MPCRVLAPLSAGVVAGPEPSALGRVGLWEESANPGTVQPQVAWRDRGHVLHRCGPRHMPVSLSVVSPTGMTEHTKSLLRAFYELSQTHRGKGSPKLAA